MVGQILGHFDRAGADGAGAAEENDVFHAMEHAGQHVPQIQIHDRRIEQQAVQQVENAANARKEVARILHPASRLKSDSIRSPTTAATLRITPRMIACSQFIPAILSSEEMREDEAGQGRNHDRAAETFPRFARADARNHFVFADQRADGIGARVAEFGDQNEIEQVVMAIDAGKEIDFLDEIQQPGDIHQAKQRGGNGENAGGIASRKELPQAKAQHEQDQKAGFEIVDPRRRAGGSPVCPVRCRNVPTISSSPPKMPQLLKQTRSRLRHHPIKLRQARMPASKIMLQ